MIMKKAVDVEAVVIGGGVVGLAVAHALAREGRDVLLLERHARLGEETSSHTSQVIHSGLYYAPGSLKARLCVQGREQLYELAARRSIAHRRTGKLVVAQTADEAADLECLRQRGTENGVVGLELWDPDRVAREEPAVRCRAALFVPVTGIIDVARLIEVLARDLESLGGSIALRSTVHGLAASAGGWLVTVEDASGETTAIRSSLVVNAAGLAADRLARLSGLDVDRLGYRIHPARGHYMRILHPERVGTARLVYPVPKAGLAGLGIHLTWTVGGEALLGPDVEWLSEAGDPPVYRVDPSRRKAFAQAAKRYLPFLTADDLVPDMAGIRPKLSGPGEAARDFVLATDPDRTGILHLLGIESPGLTSCLALAEESLSRLGIRPTDPAAARTPSASS